MYCPKCRTEYRKGFSTCADCEIPLVSELPPEPPQPPAPEYVNFINLYSPQNEVELSLIKGILDSEGISHFVRNDNFGSLEVGPHIGLYNARMIRVQDDKYEKAKENAEPGVRADSGNGHLHAAAQRRHQVIPMNLKALRTVLLFLICLVLFSCTKKTREDAVADNAQVKAFMTYFFVPGSTLLKKATEVFSLQDQYAQSLVSTDDTCSPESPCNRTKDYSLAFTPNFLFETINGRKIISGADPDAFVDLCDRRRKTYYRVRQTGTEGSIYGTFWLSDFSFAVYGIESDEAFVDVFDITAKTKTSYTIDNAKRKPDADLDAFLIAKYGQVESFQSQK